MLKPILLNTAMVQAILDGRKTVTRRVIKPQPESFGKALIYNGAICTKKGAIKEAHYQVGDVLWVRETWRIQSAHRFDANVKIEFKAGGPMKTIQFANSTSQSINRDDYDAFVNKWWSDNGKWHPSIHMPCEAARIFLKVTDVRVERLQDITVDDCRAEGIFDNYKSTSEIHHKALAERAYPLIYSELWNSTINKKDLEQFGWGANPWVFVYEFERCENAV